MKARYFFLSIILLGTIYPPLAVAEDQGNYVKVVESTLSHVLVELDLDSYNKHLIKIGDEDYYAISSTVATSRQPKGLPDIPFASCDIIIPSDVACSVDVVEAEYEEMTLSVAPSKGLIMRKVDPATVPYTFSEVYEFDDYFPSTLATVGNPYLMRDVRGCSITLNPFQYNPVQHVVRVYKKLVVKVSFFGQDIRNVAKAPKSHGKSFIAMYKNQFLNYEQIFGTESNGNRTLEEPDLFPSITANNEKMLIIACDSFVVDMRNFIIHKNNLGLPTEIVRMSQVGITADDVAEYIQDAYDADSTLTYVLLVGDEEMVPTIICEDDCFGEGGSDPSYSLLSGDDFHPDIIVGRFCAHNKNEVKTMVGRTIWHESTPEQYWHHNGLCIASQEREQNNETGLYTSYDYEYMRRARSQLLTSHYRLVYELYDGTHGGGDMTGNPTEDDVREALEEGVSVVNYLGHGYADSWETSGYGVNDLEELHNEFKLPFVFSVACNVGDFTNCEELCFAEKWLASQDCITHNPVGAVGFYGASQGQTWTQPIDALLTFNEMLAMCDSVSYGALCFQASNSMLEQHGDTAAFVFKMWNYFGDPSLSIIPHNNVGNTAFIEDRIDNDTVLSNRYVDIHNAVIQPGASVSVAHKENTRITGPFVVSRGSSFEVQINDD